MDNYNLDILGISECRWPGSGLMKLDNNKKCFIYSGTDRGGQSGVGIILNNKAKDSIMGWEPISDRLLRIRLQTKHLKMTILQCYAPTNDHDEEDKDQFYTMLNETLGKIPKHDITIVMGDMNAKIGDDNKDVEEVMGKHSVGTINNNGERFIEFCLMNGLVIGGSIFPHKSVHKLTWLSPDGITRNQIDHFCINRKFRSSLCDVRVYRGADIASDHYLGVATIRLKLKKNLVQPRPKKPNVIKLKSEETKRKFNLEIKNRFQPLSNLFADPEEAWAHMKTAYNDVALDVLGHAHKPTEEWITEDTWEEIELRKECKKRILQENDQSKKHELENEYRIRDKNVKRKARRDKRDFVDKMADAAEKAAQIGDMRSLYGITKKLAGDYGKGNERPVKDKNGSVLSDTEKRRTRWAEHFNEILNRPPPQETIDFTKVEEMEPLYINEDGIDLEELQNAIERLKNNKAAGEDKISAELLKATNKDNLEQWLELYNAIWYTEEIPNDWRNGTIVKIPKKGDLTDCNNWRGITLLSIPGKVFCTIILLRLRVAIDKRLREEQAGFRPGRSCTDQIFTLRNILEQSNEWQLPIILNFVDFQKAFDSVDRKALWNILRVYGMPAKIIKLISSLYENSECTVLVDNEPTTPFKVNTGVRQGCVLSPLLFCIAIDFILRSNTTLASGIIWNGNGGTLGDLDFADDICLLNSTYEDMQEKTNVLSQQAAKIGLRINKKKTEIMRNLNNRDPVILDGECLKEVEKFTYLGSVMTISAECMPDIKNRLSKAACAMNKLNNVWKNKNIKQKTKLKIYRSNVLSVLLYGAETWSVNKTTGKRLAAFHLKCLRRILKIRWFDYVKNETVLERANVEDIEKVIKKRRWQYLGHALRMDPERLPRQAWEWAPKGKRKRGRPRGTIRSTIWNDMRIGQITHLNLAQKAQDRQGWRALLSALCT